MASSGKKVGYLVAVVIVCLAAIGLIGTSFGTEHWIDQDYFNASESKNATDPNTPLYHINMGLFKGYLDINHGIVIHSGPFTVLEKYHDYDGFMDLGLWIATIVFICLGILFGLITIVFGIVNSFITPIELITGMPGLYVWNNLACFFTLLGMMLYVGLYVAYFKYVFKSLQDEIQFYIEEPSNLGYSFYLIIGTVVLYIVNNCFIFLTTYKVDNNKTLPQTIIDKDSSPDGQIMLY